MTPCTSVIWPLQLSCSPTVILAARFHSSDSYWEETYAHFLKLNEYINWIKMDHNAEQFEDLQLEKLKYQLFYQIKQHELYE